MPRIVSTGNTRPRRVRTTPVFVYGFAPMDSWAGWQDPCAVFEDKPHNSYRQAWRDFLPLWSEAQRCARQMGGEGTVRDGFPLVTFLPTGEGNARPWIVLGWKQCYLGTTFVASEGAPLSWLEHGFSEKVVGEIADLYVEYDDPEFPPLPRLAYTTPKGGR